MDHFVNQRMAPANKSSRESSADATMAKDPLLAAAVTYFTSNTFGIKCQRAFSRYKFQRDLKNVCSRVRMAKAKLGKTECLKRKISRHQNISRERLSVCEVESFREGEYIYEWLGL